MTVESKPVPFVPEPAAALPKTDDVAPKLFGSTGALSFASVAHDADAMCVWDGDAVVCTPSTKDEG